MTEYRVLTECGRNFAWSAWDREGLDRALKDGGYEAKEVQTLSEYQQDVANAEGQEDLNAELNKAIEEDAA